MKKNNFFKSIALSVILLFSSGFAFSQTEISTAQALIAVQNDLAGSYKLTADITLTEAWIPITDFTGTFDGNGHIIYGLTANNTVGNEIALFGKTHNATITKLGIENANVIGHNDVAAIVGQMNGGILSDCYVSNSYFEGNDHVASLVGRLADIAGVPAVVTNCYSSAYVFSRSSQAGGLIGVLLNSTVSKSYFSGVVKSVNDRPCAIVSLVDAGSILTPCIIENCVNLAPYIIGGGNLRIVSTNGKTVNLKDNYSIGSCLIGSRWYNVKGIPSKDGNYGPNKPHGADLPKDADAKVASFYTDSLEWDFANKWKFIGDGYPVLKWQTAPIKASIIELKDLKLNTMVSIDLNKQFSTIGTKLSFTSVSPKVVISAENMLSIAPNAAFTNEEEILLTVGGNANYSSTGQTIKVKLYNAPVMISTPADLALMTQYPFQYFKLSNNIDMTGVAFAGIGIENEPFMGVLDGDGFIIKNLKLENTNQDRAGLINCSYNATVKNLGMDSVRIVGNADAGGIIGNMWGGLIEKCWLNSKSYIEGRDHVGSIAGAVRNQGMVKNCYSEGKVQSRSYQAGGLVGIIQFGHVENSYQSGTVTNLAGRVCGIVSMVDHSTNNLSHNSVKNCVVLSPSIYSIGGSKDLYRIIDTGSSTIDLTNNYSLASTKCGKDETTNHPITSDSLYYGAADREGANIANDADAMTAAFYTTTMGWDLTNVWAISETKGYPTLKVFNKTITSAPAMNVDTKYVLVASGNSIQISNLETKAVITIFSAVGRVVSKAAATSSIYTTTLPSKGFYVVEINVEGQKSIVKVINK